MTPPRGIDAPSLGVCRPRRAVELIEGQHPPVRTTRRPDGEHRSGRARRIVENRADRRERAHPDPTAATVDREETETEVAAEPWHRHGATTAAASTVSPTRRAFRPVTGQSRSRASPACPHTGPHDRNRRNESANSTASAATRKPMPYAGRENWSKTPSANTTNAVAGRAPAADSARGKRARSTRRWPPRPRSHPQTATPVSPGPGTRTRGPVRRSGSASWPNVCTVSSVGTPATACATRRPAKRHDETDRAEERRDQHPASLARPGDGAGHEPNTQTAGASAPALPGCDRTRAPPRTRRLRSR